MSDRDQPPRRYDLLERVAVGGMAEIFRAKAHGAHGFEKTLAIKRILPDLARDPEFEDRFIAEAKLAVSLTHANVVQIFDFGRFAGSLCIAMEYVDGPDLGRLMRAAAAQGECVPLRAAIHVAIELCKGLEVAHARRIVHSDISPSNVLLSRAGEVKVADFGIACAAAERRLSSVSAGAPEAGAAGARARRDRVMGKWPYMSPEQTLGDPLDARSDLFSAAVVLYELFTGARLFDGRGPDEVARAVREMPIPPPSSRRDGLPPGLDQVLLRALAREKSQRTSSASELGRALVELSYAHTLVATELDLAEAVARWFPAPPQPPAAGVDADALIRAQLVAAGVAAAPGNTVRTERMTIPAPPADAGEGNAPSRVTLVRGAVGADGVPEFELTVAPDVVTGAARERRRRTARRWLALSALAVAAGGAALAATRGTRAAAGTAELRIESVPPAAELSIDGVVWPQRTPAIVTITGPTDRRPRHLRLRLDGFRDWDEDAVLTPGERVLYRPQLEPRTARLTVQSDPPGAEVLLDGKSIGRAPLAAASVAADDRDHAVLLRQHGYADARATVHLADRQDAVVDRKLAPIPRFGTIDLHTDPWSLVYLDGRKVAEAPVKGLSLPLGRHRLALVNPVLGRKATVTVDVPAKQPYRVRLR